MKSAETVLGAINASPQYYQPVIKCFIVLAAFLGDHLEVIETRGYWFIAFLRSRRTSEATLKRSLESAYCTPVLTYRGFCSTRSISTRYYHPHVCPKFLEQVNRTPLSEILEAPVF